MLVKTALVRRVQGISLAGKTDSNHWLVMDGPKKFGGSDAVLDEFEIDVTAEQRDEHPQVFTKIHLDYIIRGADIRPQDVERAIELSDTKYCSVNAMLRPAVAITRSYRLEPRRLAQSAA